MKRDIDAIRTILLAVRDSENPINSVDGMDRETFLFHAQLLKEAGLVVGAIIEDGAQAIEAVLFRLTWAGHDFADASANKTVWEKARSKFIDPSASWTFDILKDVVVSVIKDGLNIS